MGELARSAIESQCIRSADFKSAGQGISDAYAHPVGKLLFGRVLARMAGVDERFMGKFYSEAEWQRAGGMSFDELAAEALAAKAA